MSKIFFYNILLIISGTFVFTVVRDYLRRKNIKEYYLKQIYALIAGIASMLIMLFPFRYENMLFDLRAVPVFLVSYLWGWVALIGTVFPIAYRYYIGGDAIWHGIILEILIPVIIGTLFRQKSTNLKEERKIEFKRLSYAFLLLTIIQAFAMRLFSDITLVFWLNVHIGLVFFSYLALTAMVLILNDTFKKEFFIMQIDDRTKENEQLLEELKTKTKTLNAIFQIIPVGLIILDKNEEIVLLNERVHRVFNPQKGEVIDKNDFTQIFYKADGNMFSWEELPMIQSIEKGMKIDGMEMVLKSKEAQEIIVLSSSRPIYDENHQIQGVVAVFQDITNHKIIEEKLRQTNAFNQAILDAITDTLILHDMEGKFLAINKTGACRLGISVDEIVGRYSWEITSKKTWERRKKIIDNRLLEEKSCSFEDTRDGRNIANNVYPIQDKYGKVEKLVIFAQDITERKRIEESLRESEARFRGAFEGSGVGMALFSLNGNFIKVNKALCNLLGYEEKELLLMEIKDLTLVEDEEKAENFIDRLRYRVVDGYHIEKKYKHKQGHFIWVRVHASPIYNDKGEIIYFVKHIEDISALKDNEKVRNELIRKLTNEKRKLSMINKQLVTLSQDNMRILDELKKNHGELIDANNMKNRFISNISHEFKTPLNIIMNHLEFLLYDGKNNLSEDQKEMINTAYRSSDRLKDLIKDMLDLSAIESGKIKINYREINLSELISRLIDSYRLNAKKNDLKLAFDMPLYSVWINSDPIKLTQVLGNLLDNAIKFSTDGKIMINLHDEENRIRITVKDCGIGISEDELDKIFQPFYQVDQSTTKEYQGVGLGLSIASNLVEKMGGRIEISNNDDKGCISSVILPKQ